MSRRIGNVEYAKWVVVIPPDKIKEAGWKDGEELDIVRIGNKIQLKPK